MSKRLEDVVPTSLEVTFISLLITYIGAFICSEISIYLAFLPVLIFLLMCSVFIVCDALDPEDKSNVVAKSIFCLICISPILIVLIYTG
jgi:hypothetical protein